ncbi:unnamed protein product [Coffea canephora]|uniref:WRC domain-containing protein n=1 Tax=Coffea canephora TaxID=49390 RepID=A0A068UKG3_COFCA|nr:unnamed protein product [Coffea canephora]
MRIRKHAKISPLLYASSSLKPGTVIQTHVCQLNQSPWDVMTFPPPDPSTLPPPPAFLVDKDHSYFPNGLLSDHIAADQRLRFGRVFIGGVFVNYILSPGPKVKRDDIAAGGKFQQKESLRSKKEEEDEVFDRKIDGKGWQCRKKVKNQQPFCQRHLAPQPSASVKKSESGRRARPKKPASSSNPYEFYYYSGFGPRWGKKRGAAAAAAAMKEEPYTSHDSSSENTSSRNNNIIEQVLDYVEDDDEDDYDNYSKLDDDENGEMGRKRARKPIKARSLKSLM